MTQDMQVFSRPTYDRIAKYILSQDESIRIDFLQTFTGLKEIKSATMLDEHYNPLDPFSEMRKLIHQQKTKMLFQKIKDGLKITAEGGIDLSPVTDLARYYGDLKSAFPDPKTKSSVDIFCETELGYIVVEFQVVQQDFWDKRALAYVSSVFGNQLRTGVEWQHLAPVIGINLLGDGTNKYWDDGKFRRHYVFKTLDGKYSIDELQLIQYSLGDIDPEDEEIKNNKKLREWLDFFKDAHHKESIPLHIEESIQKAYELIRVDILKQKKPELLQDSKKFFQSLNAHNETVKEEGRKEGIEQGRKEGEEKGRKEGEERSKREMAKSMMGENFDRAAIMKITGLTEEELSKLT